MQKLAPDKYYIFEWEPYRVLKVDTDKQKVSILNLVDYSEYVYMITDFKKAIPVTSRQAYHYKKYLNHPGRTIHTEYKNPSSIKIQLWNDIVHEAIMCGGHDVRCIGANCYQFTAAYLKDNNSTLVVHTKGERYELSVRPVL